MIGLEAQYFKLNKILLQATALWPFQQSKIFRLHSFIIIISLVTGTVCQATTFMTSELTSKFVFKVLPCILSFIMMTIFYSSFRINMKTIKDSMEQLHNICIELKDKTEIDIIYKYGRTANRFTTLLTAIIVGALIALSVERFGAFFRNILSSTNESQSYRKYIEAEYFIDLDKYFYIYLLHMTAAIFSGILSMIAIGTFLLIYIQHTCGMFRIACYRIEQAMEINMLQNITLNNGFPISKKLVHAINIHREAMRLSEFLVNSFNKTFFCLTLISIITLSLQVFRILQVITSKENVEELVFPGINIIVLILFIFYCNFYGQDTIDHNNDIYDTAYNMQWYMCPLHVQRIILTLLERKTKEFHLTCGGMFTASFECFATLAKATMSYITLLHSVFMHSAQ